METIIISGTIEHQAKVLLQELGLEPSTQVVGVCANNAFDAITRIDYTGCVDGSAGGIHKAYYKSGHVFFCDAKYNHVSISSYDGIEGIKEQYAALDADITTEGVIPPPKSEAKPEQVQETPRLPRSPRPPRTI